ncbi:LuxR C-terminal-related transcriptional regulator [Micromonospora pisi]|uniref:response regulator transcription factor n=1 Tax=Micromonospora pisi TaxID=589240 RepID=UPI000EB384D0
MLPRWPFPARLPPRCGDVSHSNTPGSAPATSTILSADSARPTCRHRWGCAAETRVEPGSVRRDELGRHHAHSNRRIANELHTSQKTTSNHVSNIPAKLHASSRTEAAAMAHRHGLPVPD